MIDRDLPPEPVEISAGRIQLRPWEPRLAPELFAACQDPDLRRLPGGPPAGTVEGAQAWIAGRSGAWHEGTELAFAVQEPTTAALLGGFDLREFDGPAARLVGWVTPVARRRGVATAAVATLSRWAFGALELDAVRIEHVPGDEAACRLAARCGFGAPDGGACADGCHRRRAADPTPR